MNSTWIKVNQTFFLFFILVVCSAGKFKNMTSNQCEECPPGMYQPEPGQTKCLSCPEGSMIVGNDKRNYTSCKSKQNC